ncbi:MAG TPA: hypothetical protein VFJ19_17380 [Nocardioidaceae bacterium]|nr:hypothetical protein [Nocardioidaceae bacterium]
MDIEQAVCDWLADLGETFTVTPLDLADRLPAIRVGRIGGQVDQQSDQPTIDIQTYTVRDADDPRSSLNLANAVLDRFLGFPFMAGPVLVDEAHCSTGPTFIGYPDQTLSVVRAIYTLTIRR